MEFGLIWGETKVFSELIMYTLTIWYSFEVKYMIIRGKVRKFVLTVGHCERWPYGRSY
jgi:hypothetical protein